MSLMGEKFFFFKVLLDWKKKKLGENVVAMQNIAFTYPKHLYAFVCEQIWAFIYVYVCVSEQVLRTHRAPECC